MSHTNTQAVFDQVAKTQLLRHTTTLTFAITDAAPETHIIRGRSITLVPDHARVDFTGTDPVRLILRGVEPSTGYSATIEFGPSGILDDGEQRFELVTDHFAVVAAVAKLHNIKL